MVFLYPTAIILAGGFRLLIPFIEQNEDLQ